MQVYNEGYYKIPRNVKINDNAENLGLSRYAVESRLRRGENTIMNMVLPLLVFEFFN